MAKRDPAELALAARPLPRGRHKLSAAAVRADQRRRLLDAMLAGVAEHGYEATTVPAVVAAARVSTNTFYTFFNDKLECFLEVCNQIAPDLLRVSVADLPQDSWESTLREGIRRYLSWWQERPAFARAYLVELPTAGLRAIQQRQDAYEPYARIFRAVAERARSEEPDLAPLRPMAPWVLTWAVTDLVAAEVLAGNTDRLTALEEDVLWLAVQLLAERPVPASRSQDTR